SAREGRGHGSDQGEVWKEVHRQMASLGAHSTTGAMADTYDAYRHRLDEFRGRLPYIEGATGLAGALGGRVRSLDVLYRPPTCRKIWDRRLTGVVLDALEAGPTEGQAGTGDVQQLAAHLDSAPWQPTPPAGVGEEFRAEAAGGIHASALVFGGAVVHGSV